MLGDGIDLAEGFVEYKQSWGDIHLFSEAFANVGEWGVEAGLKINF